METNVKPQPARTGSSRVKVSPTNLQSVCHKISYFLDLMCGAEFKEEYFMQALEQTKNRTSIVAHNDEMEVSFSFRRKTQQKGGKA